MKTTTKETQDDMSGWLERAEEQRLRFIEECKQGGDVATVRWLERLRNRSSSRSDTAPRPEF